MLCIWYFLNINRKSSFKPSLSTARIIVEIIFGFVVAVDLPLELVFAESAHHARAPGVLYDISAAFRARLVVELV